MRVVSNPQVTGIALMISAFAGLLSAAHADITTQERIEVSGPGGLAMMNMTGMTTTTISGKRARTDSDLQFESGMLRALARGVGQSGEIVQLDADKIIELNPKKKTYSESTITQRREAMQKNLEQMQNAQVKQQQGASGVNEESCEWSEPKASVKRGGEKATIGGYSAERVVTTATQSCKDKKTGQVCDFGLTLDQWFAPGFENSEEKLAYQRAYAEKMGLSAASSRDFAERAQAMFGRYDGIWKAVAAEMQRQKGYPVKSAFALGVGGAQCGKTQQAQSGDDSASAGLPGALGALGGMFGKKKKESAPAPANTPVATVPDGLVPLMTVSTELVSVSRGPVSAQTFEVPAGYKQARERE